MLIQVRDGGGLEYGDRRYGKCELIEKNKEQMNLKEGLTFGV